MDNKKVFSEVGRWVRVSALSISTLGSIVGALLTRIREQQSASLTTAASETTPLLQPVVLVGTEEKPSLSESLALLKERAYNQDLLRRVEELTEELRQRSSRLSQSFVERGSDLSQELGKRSSDLTHEITKRSSNLTHELGKRSEKVGKNLQKQTREVSHTLAEQNSTLWIVSGFAVGMLAASTVAFILIRNRLKQQQGQDEDEHILLSQNGHINTLYNGNSPKPVTNAVVPSSLPASNVSNTTATKPTATIVSDPLAELASTESVPVEAAFLGLSSTKHYYPAQTPLDQLAAKTDQPLDIVYFSSQEEAEAQGFTAAEK